MEVVNTRGDALGGKMSGGSARCTIGRLLFLAASVLPPNTMVRCVGATSAEARVPTVAELARTIRTPGSWSNDCGDYAVQIVRDLLYEKVGKSIGLKVAAANIDEPGESGLQFVLEGSHYTLRRLVVDRSGRASYDKLENPGGGDCLYYAALQTLTIAEVHQLLESCDKIEISTVKLRQLVANHLEANSHRFVAMLGLHP